MTTTLTLSPDQSAAHDAVLDWYGSRRRSQILTMAGYAGTGKTTTLGAIARTLKEGRARIAYVCLTGKASLVLRGKLGGILRDEDYCGTIHSLIYRPGLRLNGHMTWEKVPPREIRFDLFCLDEGSMVGAEVLADLKAYGIPILAVGDHGQLPPVSGKMNLMERPDIRLEKIHRQAEGSPIIRLSMMARLEGHIPTGTYGPGVVKTRDLTILDRIKDPKAGVVLCGTNSTRVRLNASLRKILGYSGGPKPGERVVCLRNDRENGVYNGMLGEVVKMGNWCPLEGAKDPINGQRLCNKNCDRHYAGEIGFSDHGRLFLDGPIVKEQFGAAKTIDEYAITKPGRAVGYQFDWAYALTVHKSQGSEAENVIVVDECGWMPESDQRRWRYTAITRARTKLVIIGK